MKPKHARPCTKLDETEEFKELWEKVWPPIKSRYDGRADARDAFFRHVWWRDADAKEILDAARFYARSAKPDDPRLLLANWLDRGIYEDLAEQERAHQERLARVQTEQPARQERRVILSANHFMNRAANAN